jgi:hypothetical protein
MMYGVSRTIAVMTTVAVVFSGSLPTLAAAEATIEGTVKVPCDPSRVSDIALVHLRPVAGGTTKTVLVDSSTGEFSESGLTEGEYEVVAIGGDGKPLSPEPMSLQLVAGTNTVVLSMQPPGCGEQDSDLDGVPDAADACPDTPTGTAVGTDGCPSTGGKKPGPKPWKLSLIYAGVVAGLILVLYDDDDEEQASPF